MNRIVAAILLSLSLTTPAFADGTTEDAESLAGEGLSKILGALNLLMQSIPQYAAPEVQPNGDIIIRRLHPDDAPQQKPEEKGDGSNDGTET